MTREYAAVPWCYLEEFAQLTDEERGRLFTALLRYSRDGVVTELEGREALLAVRVYLQEDDYRERWEELEQKQSRRKKDRAAKAEASPCPAGPDEAPARETAGQPEDPGAADQAVGDLPEGPEGPKKAAKTGPQPAIPTREEAEAFLQELTAGRALPRVDIGRFLDYYGSLGWQLRGSPITDWRALLRNWLRQERVPQAENPAGPPGLPGRPAGQQKENPFAELERQALNRLLRNTDTPEKAGA